MKLRILSIISVCFFLLTIVSGCRSDSEGSNQQTRGRDINLTKEVEMLTHLNEFNAFVVEELFSEIHSLVATSRYEHGFIAYASTKSSPEVFNFYFCDIDYGDMAILNYTIPNGFDVGGIRTTNDGRIFVFETTLEGTRGASSTGYNIYTLTENGLVLFSEGVPDSVLINIVLDNNTGKIYSLILKNDGQYIVVYDIEGNQSAMIAVSSYVQYLVYSQKDNLLLLSENNNNVMEIYYLNDDDNSLNFVTQIDDVPHNTPLYPSETYSFFVEIDSSLFGFKYETLDIEPVISWLENGIADFIGGVLQFDDFIIAFTNDSYTYEQKILKLSDTGEKLDPSNRLILARFNEGRDFRLEEAVARFNRENPGYYLYIKNYAFYGDEAILRLNMDVLRGNAPDIIELKGWMTDVFLPIKQYISQGILLDLSHFIERDIDKNDFIETALYTLYTDDKCFLIAPSFSINALSGTKEAINIVESYTLYEFLNFIRQDAEIEKNIFNTSFTQLDFIEYILYTHLDHFIDYNSNNAMIDSDEFISLLETAKRLSPLIGKYVDRSTEWAMMYSGNQDLRFTQIWSIQDTYFDLLMLNGNHNLTGFSNPLNSNRGVLMIPDTLYAATIATEHPEKVWDFMHFLYSDELGQRELVGFPMNRNLFDERIEWFKEYLLDNKQFDNPGLIMSYYDQISSEEVDMFIPFNQLPDDIAINSISSTIKIINAIDRLYLEDINVINILREEMSVYLSSNRTAEETARVAQSRVQIYLYEIS